MFPLLRAAGCRLKAHRPFLLRILSSPSPPSSDPSPLPSLPLFQSHLYQPRLSFRSLMVRDHSTARQDCSRDTVRLGDEFESQGSLVDDNVTSGLVVLPEGESEESLVDELRDGKESVATAWAQEETGNEPCSDLENENELGEEEEDEDQEEELGSPISEDDDAGSEQSSDLENENEPGNEDEEEEEGLGSPISEDDDTGFLQETCEDDEDFTSESAELELASVEDVELLTLEEVKEVLQNVRARDVQIFPVHDRCEWTDLMVLGTGISDRHVRGIADALVYKIKKKPHIDPRLYPIVEGHVGGKWLVVDCGNMVIHVLDEESRAYYKLEDLWTSDVKPGTADQDLERMLKTAGLKEVSH